MLGQNTKATGQTPHAAKARGFFSFLWNLSPITLLALIVWQFVGPDGSKPSQIIGNAYYDAFLEPRARYDVRQAEIRRCDSVVETISNMETAHAERIMSTAQMSVLGSIGMSIIYDAMGDHAAAVFPRQRALEDLNDAQRLYVLKEYTRLLKEGAIHPRGAC